ncbi:MAG: uroporphyrinogen-III synthase [Chloroflexota bacterium]|nr:uroporphyrinogen-III synthase [Chloroflexota bacterium]
MPRDLLGATIVLTRRHEDNEALASVLRERGARVLELPCVRVAPLEDPRELAEAIRALGASDLLVLTSRSGVDAVAAANGPSSVACPVAAVGEATAEHAARLGMRVRFIASHADGATLARELPLPRGTVVLARSDLADATLPDILAGRGATVRDVVAYRTVAEVAGDAAEVTQAMERDGVTLVVASPSAVDALGALGPAVLRRATFVAIGARTARRVRERVGVTPIVAEAPDAASIARAIPSPREEVRS